MTLTLTCSSVKYLYSRHYLSKTCRKYKMIGYQRWCLLMTYDYISILDDFSIFFNGGALKTLGQRTHTFLVSLLRSATERAPPKISRSKPLLTLPVPLLLLTLPLPFLPLPLLLLNSVTTCCFATTPQEDTSEV